MILLRKMARDLLKSKVQFLSIFLMSFLGIFVFAGLDSEAGGMAKYESEYYESSSLPDLWVQGKEFRNDDLRGILSVPGVITAEKRLQRDGKAELDEELDLQMNFIESNDISRMLIVSGEPYSPGESGVWIDFSLAKVQGLSVGDVLKMKLEGTEFEEEIKGTFYHPEYVYFLPDVAAMMPDYGHYGEAFMDVSEYPMQDELYFNQVIADLEGVDNTGGLNDKEKDICRRTGDAISSVLDSDRLVSTDKDAQLSYQTFHSEIEQHQSMTYIFPIVFLLIAILGIITTMTRMTSRQRVQIGTLKALGFTKRTITIHYMSYSFFLSFAGGVIGAFTGYNTIAELIIGMQSSAYLVPGMRTAFSLRAYGAIVISAAVSALVSFLSCRKELAPAPSETLRPASPKNLKHSAIEKSRLWMKLDFATQWNIRDIMRNKVRSAMGVFGVLGCSMLLFGAFACLDTMDFLTTWMYGELNTSSYQIVMEKDIPYEVTEEYAKKYRGQMVQNAGVEFVANGIRKSGSLTVYDTGNFIHFEDKDLKEIHLNRRGISMSYKMAETLGVREGDLFRWHVTGDDKWQVSHVAGIYRNPTVQGITMTCDLYRDMEYDFIPDTIYTNMNAMGAEEDDDNIAGVQNVDDMMEAFDAMKDMMYTMVYILVIAAIVLGVVVLYNLGVLSLVEKHREMATLKVLGFRNKAIGRLLISQNLWIAAAGTLLGIPAGIWALNILMDMLAGEYEMETMVGPMSVLSATALNLGTAVIVGWMISKKNRRINMVEALKGTE